MSETNKTKAYALGVLYQKFIADSKSGKRVQSNGKKISAGTITNYECVYKLLVKYELHSGDTLRIKAINKLTQRQLLVEKNYWAKFYKNFTQYLYVQEKHYDNYVGMVIKNIKAFFNYAEKKLLLPVGNFHHQFYVPKEQIPIITLLPEQLNFLIYDTAFTNSLTKRMQQVKDTFVFGCTVALRFSDLMLLKQANLSVLNNAYYLSAKSKKTGTDSQIQLPDYAVEIIKKYKKQKGGYLLPRFNNVNLNKYVKLLIAQAGFVQPLGKKREQRGVIKNANTTTTQGTQQRFCDLVTTHTMRRTAITTMLCLGVPEHLVRKISGHSPNSKEFFRYVALAQVYQDKETMNAFAKLKDKVLQAI